MALVLKHQTTAQFIARFRLAYQGADRTGLARLAKWMVTALAAGDVTEAQVRGSFGLNAAQWATLKSKMVSLASSLDAINTAKGE